MMLTIGAMIVHAQEKSTMSIGGQFGQYYNDFGVGLNASIPLCKNGMDIRVRGNMVWHEHISETKATWTPYSNLSIGMVIPTGSIGEGVRSYTEGGLFIVIPSEKFSSDDYSIGGYGLIGIELSPVHFFAYFIEVGAVGIGAKADQIEGQPIYSNGLMIDAGFRFRL